MTSLPDTWFKYANGTTMTLASQSLTWPLLGSDSVFWALFQREVLYFAPLLVSPSGRICGRHKSPLVSVQTYSRRERPQCWLMWTFWMRWCSAFSAVHGSSRHRTQLPVEVKYKIIMLSFMHNVWLLYIAKLRSQSIIQTGGYLCSYKSYM